MTRHTQDRNEESITLLDWAYLNFEILIRLQEGDIYLSTAFQKQLDCVGYLGEAIDTLNKEEREKLLHHDGFFSCSQTGKRIVVFALQENGLNKKRFEEIEKSIMYAYKEVKKGHINCAGLEKSYHYTLETLNIFKP